MFYDNIGHNWNIQRGYTRERCRQRRRGKGKRGKGEGDILSNCEGKNFLDT